MSVVAFSCQRSVLLSMLERVSRVVDKRSAIPILNTVLVEATAEGTLSVTGTDQQILAVASAGDIIVTTPGATCVEADLFLQSLKRSTEGLATFDAGRDMLDLRVGKGRCRIPILLEEDFPRIAVKPATHEFVVPANDLVAIVEKCAFALPTNESDYYLNGVFLKAEGESLIAVATDRHKLSKLSLELPTGAAGMPEIIIPAKMVRHLPVLAGKADAPVTVAVSTEYIRFEQPGFIVQSRLVDATYPEFERIIPKTSPLRAVVPIAEVKAIVDRMLIYAPDKDRDLRCTFAEGTLQLMSRSPRGETTDELEIECDFDLAIGFNAKQMAEILGTLEGDHATVAMTAATDITVFTNARNERHLCLMMPVALRSQ